MATNALPPAEPELKSPLGTDYKTHVPNLPDAARFKDESPIEYRYRLLHLAQRVQGIHDPRLNKCQQQLAPNTAMVEVRVNPETKTSHYRGLFVCNRGWTCPVCALRISNERREELTQAFVAAKKLGFGVVMVTYTLRHTEQDSLESLSNGLRDALGRFKSGRGWQDIKSEYDVLGTIRALETLYGKNGWHPHIHELLFVQKSINPAGLAGLQQWLSDRWKSQLQKEGFDASYAHGIHVETAESKIAEYITKWGHEPKEKTWGADHEIAKLASKRTHSEGLTPFQLLECFGAGDKRAAALFQEYAAAMATRLRLRWSEGLRALLTLPPELMDEQLELPETPLTYTAVEFTALEWKKVCAYEVHALVLGLASVGAIFALRAVLSQRGIHPVYHEQPETPVKSVEALAEELAEVLPDQTAIPGFSQTEYR